MSWIIYYVLHKHSADLECMFKWVLKNKDGKQIPPWRRIVCRGSIWSCCIKTQLNSGTHCKWHRCDMHECVHASYFNTGEHHKWVKTKHVLRVHHFLVSSRSSRHHFECKSNQVDLGEHGVHYWWTLLFSPKCYTASFPPFVHKKITSKKKKPQKTGRGQVQDVHLHILGRRLRATPNFG